MNIRIDTALLVVAAVALASSYVDALPRVHPGVHRTLRKQGTVNLLVTLSATTDSTLESFKEATFESRSAQIESLKDQLQTHHKTASAEVEKLLSQESTGDFHDGCKSFWISANLVSRRAMDAEEKEL